MWCVPGRATHDDTYSTLYSGEVLISYLQRKATLCRRGNRASRGVRAPLRLEVRVAHRLLRGEALRGVPLHQSLEQVEPVLRDAPRDIPPFAVAPSHVLGAALPRERISVKLAVRTVDPAPQVVHAEQLCDGEQLRRALLRARGGRGGAARGETKRVSAAWSSALRRRARREMRQRRGRTLLRALKSR